MALDARQPSMQTRLSHGGRYPGRLPGTLGQPSANLTRPFSSTTPIHANAPDHSGRGICHA
ncbi:hypothetical protein BVI434_3100009 [Burkholderia vietnamiensis]|nr:hypothetical protein BVI434_3100009 [Burkholderia vietnamiensis]